MRHDIVAYTPTTIQMGVTPTKKNPAPRRFEKAG